MDDSEDSYSTHVSRHQIKYFTSLVVKLGEGIVFFIYNHNFLCFKLYLFPLVTIRLREESGFLAVL